MDYAHPTATDTPTDRTTLNGVAAVPGSPPNDDISVVLARQSVVVETVHRRQASALALAVLAAAAVVACLWRRRRWACIAGAGDDDVAPYRHTRPYSPSDIDAEPYCHTRPALSDTDDTYWAAARLSSRPETVPIRCRQKSNDRVYETRRTPHTMDLVDTLLAFADENTTHSDRVN